MFPGRCSSCCDAIFCNEDCRKASRLWHQYECGILHILSSVGIAHLALRVLLVTRWKLHCDVRLCLFVFSVLYSFVMYCTFQVCSCYTFLYFTPNSFKYSYMLLFLIASYYLSNLVNMSFQNCFQLMKLLK